MNDEKSISKKILLEQIINKRYESEKILDALQKELKELSETTNNINLSDFHDSYIKVKNLTDKLAIENNAIKLKNIQDDILEIARKLNQ
jgi:hypothetical protein